jgi:hypothetical protein
MVIGETMVKVVPAQEKSIFSEIANIQYGDN